MESYDSIQGFKANSFPGFPFQTMEHPLLLWAINWRYRN